MKRLLVFVLLCLVLRPDAHAGTLSFARPHRRAVSFALPITPTTDVPVSGNGTSSYVAMFVGPNKIGDAPISVTVDGFTVFVRSAVTMTNDAIVRGTADLQGTLIVRAGDTGSVFAINHNVAYIATSLVQRTTALAGPFMVDTVAAQSSQNLLILSGTGTFDSDGHAVIALPDWFTALVDTSQGSYRVHPTANDEGLGSLVTQQKGKATFEVRNSEHKPGSFDYMVVGTRRGFEGGLDNLSLKVTALQEAVVPGVITR